MLKEKIIELRKQGLSYSKIAEQLKCCKATVCYYLNNTQSEKRRQRQIKRRKTLHPYERKLNRFLYKTKNDTTILVYEKLNHYSLMYHKLRYFCGRNNKMSIKVSEIIDKFSENPTCYLTGEKINIKQTNSYEFDHMIPVSKNGPNTLDNLGICTKQANQSKFDMTPDEYINLCKKVLEHNGYEVKPKSG